MLIRGAIEYYNFPKGLELLCIKTSRNFNKNEKYYIDYGGLIIVPNFSEIGDVNLSHILGKAVGDYYSASIGILGKNDYLIINNKLNRILHGIED